MPYRRRVNKNRAVSIPAWEVLNKYKAREVRALAESLGIVYKSRAQALDELTDLRG